MCMLHRLSNTYFFVLPLQLPPILPCDKTLEEKHLLNIVADLCCFIMHEVINCNGRFFYLDQELATEEKYAPLREWELEKWRSN